MIEDWQTSLQESQKDEPACFNLLLLGDVALAGRVGQVIEQKGYSYILSNINPNIFYVDCILFNLECCLTKRGTPWEPKPVLMRGKPDYLKIFPQYGQVYIANVANNHFLDYGEEGAYDTLTALDERQIHCIGAKIKDKIQSYVVDSKDGKIAFLAFGPCAHPLTKEANVNVGTTSDEAIVHEVTSAAQHNDIVIVSLHQGVEFSQYTDQLSRKRAHRIIDAGASVVICHHTHVIQGIENYRHGIIFYGIGNFLIDIDINQRPYVKYNLGLKIQIKNNTICKIHIIPFKLTENMQTFQLNPQEKEFIFKKLFFLSNLLKKHPGILFNYFLAICLWIKLHLGSLIDMLARQGLLQTVNYYMKRFYKKISFHS
jgi:poly-gamma-glutamate synthesis protein (capsule biosynthesis protein)